MNSPTFNTIAAILENDFNLGRAIVEPGVALSELGLDPLTQLELVFAVEDAFRLRLPGDLLDPLERSMSFRHLCEVVESTHGDRLAA